MADEIKTTTPAAYEIHKGDKVVSKDGRHGKIVEVEQTSPLVYSITINYEDDGRENEPQDNFYLTCKVNVDFSKATEKSLKECCPELYRINSIVFGNKLTAKEIQEEILPLIGLHKIEIEKHKKIIDYLRKREWRLKYQMPEPTYGTPINQESEDKDNPFLTTPYIDILTQDINEISKNIEQKDDEDKDE